MPSVNINFHGASVLFETDSEEYLGIILSEYRDHISEGGGRASHRMAVMTEEPVQERIPDEAIRLSAVFPSASVYAHRGKTYLSEVRKFFIEISPASSEIEVRVSPAARISEKVRYLSKRLLVKAIEDSGLTWIHGSSACDGSGALVFTGVSGSGKTTALLTMLEKGYSMLTDDVIVFKEGKILPFCMRSMIHSKTAERFPHLRSALKTAAASEWDPQADGAWLNLGRVFQSASSPVAPRALFNTHVWNSERSECRLSDAAKTVPKLIRNYMLESGSVFEPSQAQLKRTFTSYSSLADAIPCYDLFVGRDSQALHEALRGALR